MPRGGLILTEINFHEAPVLVHLAARVIQRKFRNAARARLVGNVL